MLYDRRIRYLASAYLDADSIRATPQEVAKLLDVLGDEDLLPMSVEEQIIGGRVPRIGFQSPGGGWQVLLLGGRFNISQQPADPSGSNVLTFQEFCRHAADKLAALLGHFGRKAHRLAAVQEGLLPELSSSDEISVMSKLLHLPPTMAAHPPFEWDWRAASLVPRVIASREEKTNTILTAKRVASVFRMAGGEEQRFERIRLDIDINTTPSEVTARFAESDLLDFFTRAPEWHDELAAEFLSFVALEQVDG